MVKCMMHEPFYISGNYINESLGLWIGWVAHKGSFSGEMPIWNESKDVCLVFSGEDFTDVSDIANLRAKGHWFNAGSADYLAHLYEEKGDKFFEKLNGSFSGVLIDFRLKKSILFNDRYGLKRVYYHEGNDACYFSSEAKSLLRVLPKLRQVDYRSLAETFSCGCVLQNKTLFPGISILPGGSCWKFSPDSIQKMVYFSPSKYEEQEPLDAGEFYEQLKHTWKQVLPRYFRDNERLAMSLTGGVDGRMIMAWSQEPPNTLPCYTFGGMLRDCEDVKIAREVAKRSRQPHTVIRLDEDFISQFPDLAEKTVYITDGAMDVSGSADLYANRSARQIAPIRLTGNYGQEILRSAIAFRSRILDERLFDSEFVKLLREAEKTYAAELVHPRISFVAFKQLPWHHYSRLAIESSQVTTRSPYIDNDLVALAYRSPLGAAATKQLSLRLISEGKFGLDGLATDRGVLYKPELLMTRMNKLYLDFTFKGEYAYDYGMPQWLARIDKVISILHPEKLFLGRHKFCHYRIWYRDQLAGYLKEILLDKRSIYRTYLNGKYLKKIVDSHTKAIGNFTKELHGVLTAELIHRRLTEKH